MEQQCQNCKNFKFFHPDSPAGMCRAHPPVVLQAIEGSDLPANPVTHWPEVDAEDWCGEWFVSEKDRIPEGYSAPYS